MKQSNIHSISAIIISLTLAFSGLSAIAQKTTRKGLRVESGKIESTYNRTATADTIAGDSISSHISVAGYDKPLRSSRESFFITNNTSYPICGLKLKIEYLDIHGRTLHQREVYISIDIPVGATRQASTKSWDIQKSFYYKLSPKPKRSDGTMYDVKCTVISATIKKG